MNEREYCVHCGYVVVYGIFIKGEWTHSNGSRYCQTDAGFTAMPLQVATPLYHGTEDVL